MKMQLSYLSKFQVSGAALNLVVRANPGLKCLKARGCKNLFRPENMEKESKLSSSYSCEELFIELGKTCRLEEIALGWGFSYFSLQDLKPAILSLRAMTVGLGGSLPEDSLRLLPTTCPLLESLVLYFQVPNLPINKFWHVTGRHILYPYWVLFAIVPGFQFHSD